MKGFVTVQFSHIVSFLVHFKCGFIYRYYFAMPRNICTLIGVRMRVAMAKGGIEMPCKLLGTVTNTNLLEPYGLAVLALVATPKDRRHATGWGVGCSKPLCTPSESSFTVCWHQPPEEDP